MRLPLAATLLLAGTMLGACSVRPIEGGTPAGSSVRIELATGLGSGVYIGNGVIITAAHVVADAVRPVLSRNQDGSPVYGQPVVRLFSDQGDVQDGEVLWLNKDYDIAAIRPTNAKRFMPADLTCRPVILGEELMAEGNPVGVKFIQMHGYVSGEPREFLPNWKSGFVTDMTVISGMSGGGIYDQFGEIIGITVGAMDPHGKQGEAAAGGMGFAVPSSVVCELLGRAA